MSTAASFPDPRWRSEWSFAPGAIYLNHGSFGPAPRPVQEEQAHWIAELNRNPMDFFVRRLDELLDGVLETLGRFVGARPGRLALVSNSTVAMNVVADSLPLQPGDEVLFSGHEYGAVLRIWRRRCDAAGAQVVVAPAAAPVTTRERFVDELFSRASAKTRLVVVSHVTSPTAAVLPVDVICRRAREMNIPVCIDGPHAVAMRPLALDELGCDFYCAGCHKWLCASFGAGFLYVRGQEKQQLHPPQLSWGRSLSGRPTRWQDELHWFGTHQPAAWLSIPAAIRFLEGIGLGAFRDSTHALVRHARERIAGELGAEPVVPEDREWYGSMATLALPWGAPGGGPPGGMHPLQQRLWEQDRIEVPIVEWSGRVHVRVSCHMYNTAEEVDLLVKALKRAKP